MSSNRGLANLITPQTGKMRQISSQGRQEPMPILAKAIGDAPGKSVQIQPGETYTIAEIKGSGTILRIWMTTMQPMPGLSTNFNHYLVLRFHWDGEEMPPAHPPACTYTPPPAGYLATFFRAGRHI
jgi:hypothetical protein